MGNLGSLLTTAAVLIALATSVGVGLQTGVVKTLRDRLKDADDENTRLERRLEAAEEGLDKAQRDLEALGRVVSKEVQITALIDQVQHLTSMMTEIRDEVRRRSE